MIQDMTTSNPPSIANDKGKKILVNLFPSWLLPAYQIMFANPFPKFSAWMNAWVTLWTTKWLMGPSKIYDVVISENPSVTLKDQGLLVEKCRFLETSGCVATCTHACKIPTQRFFLESMGVPMSIKPNLTDYSCKFEFGIHPTPLMEDEIMAHPCLRDCTVSRRRRESCLQTKVP